MDQLDVLEEFYFTNTPAQAAVTLGLPVPGVVQACQELAMQGLLKREDEANEVPINDKTLLVATKQGLMQANGMA